MGKATHSKPLSPIIYKTSNQRGQVAILFALVFTFMFVLFMFVVDFAHLINNKINLQLAADAAAYAGAAQQARVLNRIGMVNYRMRQNVKEFAMRVNVTHRRHNRNFPRGPQFYNGGNGPSNAEDFLCQQAHGYQAISGLRYATDTNLCKNASPNVGGLPPIVVPPVIASFDPFIIAIRSQIQRIQQAANQECRAAANDNRILAQYLRSAYTRRSQFFLAQVQALEAYLNSLNGEVDARSSQNAIVRAAYQSALRNLSISNNTDEFRLEVLQPEGGQFIQLRPRNLDAAIVFMNFQVQGNGCIGLAGLERFNDMVAGVTKIQSVLTYFAVRATAKPRMFFMPSRWVEAAFPELTAYASAKPFGSRLGPQISADPLLPVVNGPGNANPLLNFSTRPGDRAGIRGTKMMAFYDALHPFNNIGRPQGNRQSGWPIPRPGGPADGAMVAVRAPTIFDAAFFTIYPDVGSNANTDYLEPQFAQALYPDFMEAVDASGNQLNTPRPPRPSLF